MYNNGTSDDRSKITNTNITGFANTEQCERRCTHVNERGIWCEIQGDEILAVLFTNSVIKKRIKKNIYVSSSRKPNTFLLDCLTLKMQALQSFERL
jgi:hypothetical protein